MSSGVIIQRFPEKNWDDTPFIDGIEWFCQPQGWSLSSERSEPRFHVSVLTDIDANRHYCAALCFNETRAITPTKPADEDEDPGEGGRPTAGITHHSIMYAPKCLAIVSRQDYIDTFRNCLGIIYTVYVESVGVPLETLVGNLVGCVLVPPPGGPQVRFSIGAGDRQALQPPAAPPLPVTQNSVHMLFQLLGIHNAVTLWCAVMSEHKVLLHSAAGARLAAAGRALAALMFPFRYAHVYVPLLPAALAEVLATPTPFLIGLHSHLKEEVVDVLDVIVADLDSGSLSVPASLSVPRPSEPFHSQLLSALGAVLQPALRTADSAFPPPPAPPSPPHMLDKEIRAVFMRSFAQLLQGYRSCLTIIRIHPSPVLTFHKAGFLGARGLAGCAFAARVLDCMFFNGFVAERGPPWRPCDIWDELYTNLPEQLRMEAQNPDLRLVHIQELAMQLHLNENPNPQSYQQRVLRPPEGVSARIHQPPLPLLDAGRVQAVIDEGLVRNQAHPKLSSLRPPQPRIVPLGAPPSGGNGEGCLLLTNSARRLEVLRNCVTCIFEGKIADARKSFPAVLRALRAPAARLALTAELAARVPGNKAVLQHQQFDLIVRLMNCALQDASALDEHGVAAALLPLATAFCRKLCTGVIQFAYMCIQEHPVWSSQQFWEAAFYQDVQRDIKALYASTPTHQPRAPSPRDEPDLRSILRAQEPSALEIAAEQMRIWPNMDPDKQREVVASEQSTLYSQAVHYANRMVYLLVPLEGAGRRNDAPSHHDADRGTNSVTNSVAESDSADAESGFEEADPSEAGNYVIKFVSRFVDKVCTEGGVSADHVRCLHQMVPGVVHMHLETLEAVARESRRLPPIQKPRILTPGFVTNETIAAPALRAFLVADGRGATSLLPAEGALFLTNYRIIFKGAPTDPFACEQTVVRSFPIMSLTKEKPVRMQYLPHLDQCLQEGLQLRSATFQLIKVAFDEEVSGEQVENVRKLLARLRHPVHALQHFAFAGRVPHAPALHAAAEKHATLKGFAKKTLLKTARRAGLKPKTSSKRQKYVLPAAGARSLTSPPLMGSLSADTLSLDELETCVVGESEGVADARTLERLSERSYARDWQRCGLAAEPFRLTPVNAAYSLCRSYPALLAVPASVGDDSLRRFARCYRQGRVPALCWRHPRTGALLARSAASHHKGVMGMLKASSHQNQANNQGGTETTSSLEQERYIVALAQCTPSSRGALEDSSLSLDSLFQAAEEPPPVPAPPHTPLLSKAAGTLGVFPRGSGGKSGLGPTRYLGRLGSLKDRRHGSHLELFAPGGTLQRQRNSGADVDSVSGEASGLRRASLYVLLDKGSGAWCGTPGVEAVPVEYADARATKHAFKKLMRAAVPSAASVAPDEGGFLRLVEESGWLWQLRSLFQLSGAVVDLLDLQGSSVLLSLEEGWDVTAQVSSLAQLCLDPYYRTLDGFRVLVEKEWLALGHRFQHRNNLQQGFTPTFLQFLDAVHQIQKQFPLAFEFNEFYLRFVAYHSVSCRFRTFLLDCEAARTELGIAAADDKRGSLTHRHRGVETGAGSDDDTVYPGGGAPSPRAPSLGQSLFDYIDKQHQRAPLFYNFYYTPDLDNPVLRPVSAPACLEVWSYYVSEELGTGAAYELEAVQQELCRREEHDAADGVPLANRRLVTAGYDIVSRSMADAFSGLLERLRQLELELGHLPQKWRVRWDQLELPNTDELTRHASFSSALVRRHGRLSHKRSTLDVLVRGRLASLPAPHRFAPHHRTAPTHCDHCESLLFGPVKTGVQCVDCGYVCHERCAEGVAAACTRHRAATTAPPDAPRAAPDATSVASSVATLQTSSQQYYEQFSSNVAENKTHEGHLYKRGALLKGWKQRWFVLDSIKHQLRYYDAVEDSHCKGFIDLAEVITVTQAPPAPGPPKKTDDRSFFDLRTSRRTYNFCASKAAAAQDWIEKLQACLQ